MVPPSCLPPGPADPEVATVLGDVAPGPTVELEVGDGPEGGDPGGGADGDATEAPTALPAAAEGGGARHLDAMQRLAVQLVGLVRRFLLECCGAGAPHYAKSAAYSIGAEWKIPFQQPLRADVQEDELRTMLGPMVISWFIPQSN